MFAWRRPLLLLLSRPDGPRSSSRPSRLRNARRQRYVPARTNRAPPAILRRARAQVHHGEGDRGKKAIETGPIELDPNNNALLIVPLTAPLPDGKYTVDWQVVATDGHKTKGSYSFESMK